VISPALLKFLFLMNSKPIKINKKNPKLAIPSHKNNGCLHSPSIYIPGK
jgi:hypothetical protein